MFLVAVTGGIATGKSTVCKIFRDNGIPVIDADLIARQVIDIGTPAYKRIKAEFGDAVFKENGEIDRIKLGQIAFNDIEKRKLLNYITHPEIHNNIYKQIVNEEDIQLTRLMDRNGLSEADAKKRISAQMPIEKKCEQSHFIIDNSCGQVDTEGQTLKILQILLESNHHWKIRSIILATAAVFVSGIAWLLNYRYKIFSE